MLVIMVTNGGDASTRRVARAARALALAFAFLGTTASPVLACSLGPPWAVRDTSWIGFIGTALRDTVLAGAGAMRSRVAPGHFGAGAARSIYGQRVRVDALGTRATRAFPRGAREVVLVPWDYDAGCAPVAWSGSAQWMPPGTNGLFRAKIRAQEHWVDGLPTFDLLGIAFQPYGVGLRSPAMRSPTGAAERERLAPEALLRFYDDLPPYARDPDSLVALTAMRRLAADTVNRGLYPVNEVLWSFREEFEDARRRAIRPPITGTFRFELSRDGGPTETLFVRTDDAATTTNRSEPDTENDTDPSLVPPEPNGYSVIGSAARTLDGFAASCHVYPSDGIDYIDLDWHGRLAADGSARYRGDLGERFIEVLLRADSVAAWRARKVAGWLREADSLNAVGGAPPSDVYVPYRPLAYIQEPDRPMRVEGSITYPQLGTYRVRGVRISDVVLPCSH